jgi:hypothetical protein|tara:strand:- start:674 stop:1330 length:657 start_codon:yes stop_codon:yes gene_type:complete
MELGEYGMTYLLRLSACLFFCVGFNANASFYDIRVEASGVLTYVDGRFSSIDEGDSWSVTINYEDVNFLYLHGGGASYYGGLVSGTFQIGSHTSNFLTGFNGDNLITVSDCYGCLNELHLAWGYQEAYLIDNNRIGALALRVESGLNPPSLSNTNLTDVASVINDFEFSLPNPSIMSFTNRFEGSIQNFSISEVPLPAGIYLFLSGLVGLGLIRGRNA